MNKKTTLWLILATVLTVVGGILFTGVMTTQKWDFTKLSTVQDETNHHTLETEIKNISIVSETADILLIPAEKASVECVEEPHMKHTVTLKDGTLTIQIEDTRKWYEHIGIHFGFPKITVSLPEGSYGTLSVRSATGKVTIPADYRFESIDMHQTTGSITNLASAAKEITLRTTTGSICVENVTATAMRLSVSTGKINVTNAVCSEDATVRATTGDATLTQFTCRNLTSDGSTGDLLLTKVIAKGTITATRSTGKIRFEESDAAEIYAETDTGSVTGTLLSEKIFFAESDTGRVDVPKTVTGGKCEIHTDTGNIRLQIK